MGSFSSILFPLPIFFIWFFLMVISTKYKRQLVEKFQLIFFKRRRLNVSGLVKCSFQWEGMEKKEEGAKNKDWGGDEVAGLSNSFNSSAHPIVCWEECPLFRICGRIVPWQRRESYACYSPISHASQTSTHTRDKRKAGDSHTKENK